MTPQGQARDAWREDYPYDHRFDCPGKDPEVVGRPDPLIVGPASRLFEEGEMTARLLRPVTSTSRTTDF